MTAKSVAITGCSVLTPRAMTLREFAEVLDRPAPPPQRGRLPFDRFDPQQHLGQRGYKYLTPATQYALAAAQAALDDAGFDEAAFAPDDRAILVGTNFGVHAVLAGMDRVILTAGAQHLRPMEAPNFSVNIPASYLSMKHHFTAANLTVTTAQVAGLDALLLAADMLHDGRARVALVCATEDAPPPGLEEAFDVPLAEGGACALVVESLAGARARGAAVRGEIWNGVARFVIDEREIDLPALIADTFAPAATDASMPQMRGAMELARRFGECASVSPLLQVLAMCASEARRSIVAAASVQGHVVLLSGRGYGLRPEA